MRSVSFTLPHFLTEPPKVSPEVTHVDTNGINVTWTPVKGVDKYIVSLATAGVTIRTVNISNNESTNQNLSLAFSHLLPATIYTVTITTVSGSFSEPSDPVTIATCEYSNRTDWIVCSRCTISLLYSQLHLASFLAELHDTLLTSAEIGCLNCQLHSTVLFFPVDPTDRKSVV